jgi:excisionase family DNA binding protein
VKNIGKNRSEAESFSVSEAAAALGVSIPTVKRMVAEGRLEAYRTPGSHLRVLAESVDAMREGGGTRAHCVRDASTVLQNRREHLEMLNLEVQEHRTQRELEKMRAEEREEAERRRAEAEARERETAQRQQQLELEREALERQKAEDRRQREAEQRLATLRARWLEVAAHIVSEARYGWLTAPQRKEVLDALEAEIESRQPTEDHGYMASVIVHTLLAALEPFETERNAQERRRRLTQAVLWKLPYSATDAERAQATTAVREALKRFDAMADETEMRVAAQQAIEPIARAIEKRLLDARLLNRATVSLPWSATDQDKARVRRECAEILAELPQDLSEAQAKEALEPTIQEAHCEIKARETPAKRTPRK